MRRTTSRLSPLVFALIGATGLLTTAMAAQRPAPLEIHAQALDTTPESRREGDQAMDGAVAAAVIGAVSTQFDERHVGVKLDTVDVQPASLRDRNVSGEGRLNLGDDQGTADAVWIPFRFEALYDTQTASVSYPVLVIGDAKAATATVALDSVVARSLAGQVDAALDLEFAQQPAQIRIDHVTTSPVGSRYLRVEARGTADFADEGTTAAQVQALYDRKTGQWLHLAYELGTTSNWADTSDPVVAVR